MNLSVHRISALPSRPLAARLLAVTAFAAVGLLSALHPGEGLLWTAFQNTAETVAAGLATLACAFRAKRERAARLTGSPDDGRAWIAWALIAAGLCAWTVGQLGWTVVQLSLGEAPVEVSPLDGAFLLSPLLIVAGLLTMVRTPAGYLSKLRAVVEGLFIAAGVLLLSWSLVVGSVALDTTRPPLAQTVNLAYPLLDVLALASVLFVSFWRRNDRPPGLGLIAIGIGCMAISDSSFWYASETAANFTGSTSFDVGWLAAFALIALGAWQQLGRNHPTRRRLSGRALLAVPALPAMAGVSAVFVRWTLGEGLGSSSGALLAILCAVVLLAAALLLSMSYENDALRGDLERKVGERTAELHATERHYRAVVQHASDVVIVVEADHSIRYLSDSALDVFGFQPAEFVGRQLGVLGAAAVDTLTDALDLAALAPKRIARVQWLLDDATGRTRHVEATITVMLADPDVRAFVLNTRDITERVELEEQLRHQVFHDHLTGLPNRALLRDRAAQAFARSRRSGAQVAAIMIDLDAFKTVNDSLGHRAGDELLRDVAKRLQSATRTEDTVARMGGDEFLVLLDTIDSPEWAYKTAERLHRCVLPPFPLTDGEFTITASVGVAVGSGSGTDFEQLVSDADLAMYTVKAGGKDAALPFQPSMHMQAREHLRLQSDLRKAMANDELWLLYEPAFDIRRERLVGFEALVRWNHPTHGLIPPSRFIGLAEESGLIVALGRWVLGHALQQAVAWDEIDGASRSLSIAVSVSSVQLKAPGLVADVRDALARTGIAPERVVLEIAESSLIEDPHQAIDSLQSLKALGVRIAIDDFGTGYASLASLQRMPVDILKIDRTFVVNASARGREMLAAIVGIGRTLSLLTVAQGVEQPGQLEMVKSFGCDLAQGYLLGKPIPPDESRSLIERQSSKRLPSASALK
jgi:diguanylate cyclase (GGDEF)-like protein/PAS domain S-box-containing protein